AVAGGLALARAQGWRWQGLAWDNGLVLKQLSWGNDDCTRLLVENMRLYGLWPLRAEVARAEVGNCAMGGNADGGIVVPPVPLIDVVVQMLQVYDYPAARIAIDHRGSRWWVESGMAGSNVQASYTTGNQRWQLTGQVA